MWKWAGRMFGMVVWSRMAAAWSAVCSTPAFSCNHRSPLNRAVCSRNTWAHLYSVSSGEVVLLGRLLILVGGFTCSLGWKICASLHTCTSTCKITNAEIQNLTCTCFCLHWTEILFMEVRMLLCACQTEWQAHSTLAACTCTRSNICFHTFPDIHMISNLQLPIYIYMYM